MSETVRRRSFTLARSGQLDALMAYLRGQLAERPGRPLRVQVEPWPSRTHEQNAYLHLAIRQLAQHLGMAETELKDALKERFGPVETIRLGRRTQTVRKSVGRYTVQEAGDMIEHVHRIAAEEGLLLDTGGNW